MDELPEWAESLPEVLREAPHVKGAETPEKWLQQIKNDSAWRAQSIRVPGSDADESVLSEFHEQLRAKVPSLIPTPTDDESAAVVYAQLGKPEKAEGYKVPEDVELDNIEEYKAAAHELDMTQKAFERWISKEASGKSDRLAMLTDKLQKDYDGLKGEWGAAFDKEYGKLADLMRDAPEGVQNAYKDMTLPVEQVKWLHGLADLAQESPEVIEQKGKDDVMTPDQAAMELADIQPKFYGMRKSDPNYRAMQAKVERLTKLKLGMVA